MIIKSYERGLLFKNEEFIQLLMPGSHFMFNLRNLKIYNITEPFVITTETLLHLKDISLQNELILTDVKDNEICLHYEEDKFKSVLKTGVHAYWKCQIKHSFFKIDLNNPYIDPHIEKQVFLKPEIFAYINCFIVENFEKGLLFIDKKFDNILNPGEYYFWKGSKNIRIEKVDMRQQQIEIAGQEIMSKDKITLRLNFVCQYKIQNPERVVNEIKDYATQLYVSLQLILREYIGTLSLDEILSNKEEIGNYVSAKLKIKAVELGLELNFTGVKDIILPGEIKNILNQVLIAEKTAQANLITRREETASTRSLLNTAKLMEDNQILYKLKEMEYIERISEKISQITIGGGTQVLEQLKEIFVPKKS